ncbi:hypothetical protein [Cyanothece sp. BG0011]|uniref:hypothetical protein n=1 Tax=Cyanothece sp. BG0011 TaxID=2082950 RepID=UPI000D1DEE8B|nr:hypothetical protein [Cyanothece sp. BG0011]
MSKTGKIYCFHADYRASTQFDAHQVPDWLSLEVHWKGYCISTVPWVADVARVLGVLPVDDTPEAWMNYLQELGLKGVTQVCCEDFYEDRLYS